MKRKQPCLIENFEAEAIEVVSKRTRAISIGESSTTTDIKMHKNSPWFKTLLNSEKSSLIDNKIMKIHYKLQDGREMVEEYNLDTQVMLRRVWKVKGALGGDGKWDVEIGDPIYDNTAPPADSLEIVESKDQPMLTRRNTKINLEWRIRNLPYPIENYSISANQEEKRIIIRTTNKKYFKKLEVPELERLNLPFVQANIQSSHKFNTLIVTYKKPQELLDMEKDLYEHLKQVKPVKDVPNDCKAQ